jgi:hypothetical protein
MPADEIKTAKMLQHQVRSFYCRVPVSLPKVLQSHCAAIDGSSRLFVWDLINLGHLTHREMLDYKHLHET